MRTGMRTVDEVKQWAEKFGCPLLDAGSIVNEWELMSCLPMSEQDEVQAKAGKLSENQFDRACAAYFDAWDVDYMSGFCTSIRDRIMVGKYMAEHNFVVLSVVVA